MKMAPKKLLMKSQMSKISPDNNLNYFLRTNKEINIAGGIYYYPD